MAAPTLKKCGAAAKSTVRDTAYWFWRSTHRGTVEAFQDTNFRRAPVDYDAFLLTRLPLLQPVIGQLVEILERLPEG